MYTKIDMVGKQMRDDLLEKLLHLNNANSMVEDEKGKKKNNNQKKTRVWPFTHVFFFLFLMVSSCTDQHACVDATGSDRGTIDRGFADDGPI